jgi:hypothetical protein
MTVEIVRAFAMQWLLAHGYGYHADAVLKYIEGESGFEVCVEKRTGHFLFQWVGSRVTALHNFAGPGCPGVETQLEFADQELRSGLYARFWSAPAGQDYKTLRRTFGQGHRS